MAKLDEDWYLRGGLFLIFAVSGMLTALSTWMHRGQAMGGLKIALYVGALAIGVVPLLLIAFQFLACERQNAIYGGILGWLNLFGEPELQRRATVAAFTLLHKYPQQLDGLCWSGQTALTLALAGATAVGLAIAHRRFASAANWASTIRQAILGFLAVLGVSCAVDAFLISLQRDALEERAVRDYPELYEGAHVEAEVRPGRIGDPFKLNFADAITGRPVSIAALRGRVVVVDFWASFFGRHGDHSYSAQHIEKMKKLYAEYHDKGVELIGVSLDVHEEHGGLDELKACVAKHEIPWPQFHDGVDSHGGTRPGAPTAPAHVCAVVPGIST